MKPYRDNLIQIYQKDCCDMSELPDESVDLIATDPPYGISFMGKDWDRALPDKRIWAECLRVLKPGAFAFVMCIPRSDCLSRMIISLEDAGFWVNFTPIFWAYASGFPKAMNMAKAVQKLKLGVPQGAPNPLSPSHGKYKGGCSPDNVKGQGFGAGAGAYMREQGDSFNPELTDSQAQALDGSYGGFQPKPAVEVIIVAMKPLSEKTFVDQALKNQKGITWLDDGRIPYENQRDKAESQEKQSDYRGGFHGENTGIYQTSNQIGYKEPLGRFPANLICSDDVLDDGRVTKSEGGKTTRGKEGKVGDWGYKEFHMQGYGDSGSFSRYFDLDKWWAKTFPFLIVPKASKSEKNKGIGIAVPRTTHGSTPRKNESENKSPNYHPTVKPLKLMSYLITLGSREGDTVVDNFGGSGTTAVAARLLGRKCIMYEIDERYCEIAVHRLRQMVMELAS